MICAVRRFESANRVTNGPMASSTICCERPAGDRLGGAGFDVVARQQHAGQEQRRQERGVGELAPFLTMAIDHRQDVAEVADALLAAPPPWRRPRGAALRAGRGPASIAGRRPACPQRRSCTTSSVIRAGEAAHDLAAPLLDRPLGLELDGEVEPAANSQARSMRTGSSWKRTSGSPMARISPLRRSSMPPT